jgi:hypothetical protein
VPVAPEAPFHLLLVHAPGRGHAAKRGGRAGRRRHARSGACAGARRHGPRRRGSRRGGREGPAPAAGGHADVRAGGAFRRGRRLPDRGRAARTRDVGWVEASVAGFALAR